MGYLISGDESYTRRNKHPLVYETKLQIVFIREVRRSVLVLVGTKALIQVHKKLTAPSADPLGTNT